MLALALTALLGTSTPLSKGWLFQPDPLGSRLRDTPTATCPATSYDRFYGNLGDVAS